MTILHPLHTAFIGYLFFTVFILKFLIITFKAIYNISPSYICNLVSIKSFLLTYFLLSYFLLS